MLIIDTAPIRDDQRRPADAGRPDTGAYRVHSQAGFWSIQY